MASRKPSGELPNQGFCSPYKTNNEHYFLSSTTISARTFLQALVCRILFSRPDQILDQILNQNTSKIQGNCDKQYYNSSV